MPHTLRAWSIDGDSLKALAPAAFKTEYLEKHLEKWISQNPDLLGERLLIIDRQVKAGVLRPDFLCLDEDGILVIVELKRGIGPRKSIAQLFEYGAWLNKQEPETILKKASVYLAAQQPRQNLLKAAQKLFGDFELSLIDPKKHRLLLLAAATHEQTDASLEYLTGSYKVPIEAVSFDFIKVSGTGVLMRRVLETTSKTKKKRPVSTSTSAGQHLGGIAEALNPLEAIFGKPQQIPKGLRYWWRPSNQQARVLLGLDLAGSRWNAPPGELDVWIRFPSFSEMTGKPESKLRRQLQRFQLRNVSPRRVVVRLKSTAEANKFVEAIKEIAGQPQSNE